MDEKKILTGETSNEQNASSKKENFTENLSKPRNENVDGSTESEQSNDICSEEEKIENKSVDIHAKSEARDQQKVDEMNLDISSSNEKRKVIEQGKLFRTISVKSQKNIKCGRVEKPGRQRRISLRRSVLHAMTMKKYLSELEECTKLLSKSPKSQSELQETNPEIADEEKEETINDIFKSIDTNSSFLNIFQGASANTEESTNENQPTNTTQSTSAPTTLHVTSTTSQFKKKVRSGGAWKHFLKFMQTKEESTERNINDVISRENIEPLDNAANRLEQSTQNDRELAIQNFSEPVKTETESVTKEMQDSLNDGISGARDDSLTPVLKVIEQIRAQFLKETRKCEDSLMSKKEESQQEQNMQKKITFLIDAKEIQKTLHRYYDAMYNDDKLFKMTKEQIMNFGSSKYNLSNITSLMELHMSAEYIRTFSSLFFYLHQSLYSEVSIENIFEYINSENIALAYKRYRERKLVHASEREKSKNTAIKLVDSFNLDVVKYHQKMKPEIPDSYSSSDNFENYTNDIKIAVQENLNCFNKLISVGSSVVFPVAKYLGETRKTALFEFHFLHKRRSDVFPLSK